MDVKE